jgi:membrane protease YdiL (CAAX protease family)
LPALADVAKQVLALLLAVGVAWFMDRRMARRGLLPPGFAQPGRRLLGGLVVASILWIGAFLPLASFGESAPAPAEFGEISIPQLFALHALLLLALGAWYGLGFAGRTAGHGSVAAQFGLRAPRPVREVGLGALIGVSTWSLLILALLVIVSGLSLIFGDEVLPTAPPAVIPLIAGLPILVRIGISLSAGAVEELFFRGFLQPRLGVAVSTVLFALAHAGYGQPLLLVGVTLLSLLYAAVVRWRQSLWAAMAAHAVFDGVQLLIVIPSVLELFGGELGLPVAGL